MNNRRIGYFYDDEVHADVVRRTLSDDVEFVDENGNNFIIVEVIRNGPRMSKVILKRIRTETEKETNEILASAANNCVY